MLCLEFLPDWSFNQRRSYGDKKINCKTATLTVSLLQIDGWISGNPLMQ